MLPVRDRGRHPGGYRYGDHIAKTTTTDSSGGYRFSNLVADTYTVSVTAKTFGKVISPGIIVCGEY